MQKENPFNIEQKITELQGILNQYRNRRVVVVGTTCTGKSTFLKYTKNSHDMDDLVFPLLTDEEAAYVNQTPWTPKIGQIMTRLVKEKVKIQPGEPVFGTVVIDSDLIVNLKISDELLEERTKLRNANFEDAKNMQQQIDEEVERSGIPKIDFSVG